MKMLDGIEAGMVVRRLGLLEVRNIANALGLHPEELLKCYEDELRPVVTWKGARHVP